MSHVAKSSATITNDVWDRLPSDDAAGGMWGAQSMLLFYQDFIPTKPFVLKHCIAVLPTVFTSSAIKMASIVSTGFFHVKFQSSTFVVHPNFLPSTILHPQLSYYVVEVLSFGYYVKVFRDRDLAL